MHISRHLGDALSVIRNRTEGVHRDDDADGGEKATTSKCDREQRQRDRARPKQVCTVHGSTDEKCAVHRGLKAHRDTVQDDGGWAGQRRLRHIINRTTVGLGEVAGELLDCGSQHDSDEHCADGNDARVDSGRVGQAECERIDITELRHRIGQVDPGHRTHEKCGDDGRDEEATIDRRHT